MRVAVAALAAAICLTAGFAQARFVGDVNADGTVDVLDTTLLRREIAGLEVSSSMVPDISGAYSGSGTLECPTLGTFPASLVATVTQVGDALSGSLTVSGGTPVALSGFVTPDGTIHGATTGDPVEAAMFVGNLNGDTLHATVFLTNNILTATERGLACTLRVTLTR